MTSRHPFLERVDHIGIHADDPEQLFRFFTDVLDVPVAFPFTSYPNYTSGSVVLGNIFLELMRFGSPPRTSASTPQDARYFIVGFINGSSSLADTLTELEERRIPHSGVVPFFAPDATDQNPVKIWSNVFLGNLLGSNLWMRLLFRMTKQADPTPSAQQSRLINAVSTFMLRQSFRRGMPVLTEYYQRNSDEKQAADRAKLRERAGGSLGIEYVREIVIGAPGGDAGTHAWSRFLAPLAADDDGRYDLGAGPAIRIVRDTQPRIQTTVLTVASIAQAEAFLHDAGYSVDTSGDHLKFLLPQTSGVTVHLVE